MKAIIFFILFITSATAHSQSFNSDTLKIIVETKYGELAFTNICDSNKFNFTQSKNPIIDEEVETEAFEKNIKSDTLSVKFSINKKGEIIAFEIVSKSKIDKLNIFLSHLFNDAISNLKKKKYSLNCNNKENTYIIPLTYFRQKSK